jgi:ADP-ribose pyrophosphatase YjhB (NUDIX family)
MAAEDVRRALEPALRRVLHLFWRVSRGLTLGVRGAVIDEAGRILLVKHSYVSGWHLPGGGVEAGETTLEALTRELAEEGNITVTGAPVLHGLFFNDRVSRRDHVAVFVVRAFRQDARPAPNREIIACDFFALDSLPAETTPGTRRRIAEVFEGAVPSERW